MRLELLEQYNNHLKLGDQYHMIHRRIVSRLELEAAKEVNANGMGIKKNGMLSHISQMMVQRLNKQMKGEGDVDNIDILGNTTESAIQATKQALYNLDHPLEYVPKSIEVQRACMKEREFYVAFLERLEKL